MYVFHVPDVFWVVLVFHHILIKVAFIVLIGALCRLTFPGAMFVMKKKKDTQKDQESSTLVRFGWVVGYFVALRVAYVGAQMMSGSA